MQKSTLYLTIVIGSMLIAARPANAQDKIYIRLESATQGAFQPNKPAAKGNSFMECKNVTFLSTAMSSGSAKSNGVVKLEPMKVTIESTVAAPQLLQDQWTNKVLKTIQLEFTHASLTGKEQIYMTVALTNAIITSVELQGNQEVVQLKYQKMEMTEPAK
jgi:type VI secretion system Hcp family effector